MVKHGIFLYLSYFLSWIKQSKKYIYSYVANNSRIKIYKCWEEVCYDYGKADNVYFGFDEEFQNKGDKQ